MVKKLGLFFIVTLSMAFMLWSGKYIYHKQSKGIDFNSFIVSDSASVLFVPNSNQFLKKKITLSQFDKFKLPKTIKNTLDLLLSQNEYDFNSKISLEIYTSFSKEDFSIVFKNYDLTIDKIIAELSSELNITATSSDNKLNINESSFYYEKNGDFFTISNLPIVNKKSVSIINAFGNFDYSYQTSSIANPTFYKHNSQEVYSFSKTENDTLAGVAVNPITYFKNIPDNFDELYFYGSTRIDKDINKLLNTENDNNFYTWAKNSVIHLKKDSFELLIGIQNNIQNLKYILDEQTLELSNDSLLPTPIYKNNFEVSFFKSNYNWQKVIPNSNHPFSVYTELNNFNILANSTEAIDWYIKQMQLGNNYYNTSKNISIPTKINKLHIDQRNSNTIINIDNWVEKTSCFHSTINIGNQIQKTRSTLPLISNFLIKDSKTKLSSFLYNDSLYILLYDDQNITCYDIIGNLEWNKNLPSPLIKEPTTIIIEDNSKVVVLFMENQINIIDEWSNSLPGFPYQYNGVSKDGLIIKYDNNSDYRILINVDNRIINLNLGGDPVEGWNFKPFTGNLKSNIHYSNSNGKDYIYFKDSNDSLYVLNRKGENRFTKHFKFKSLQADEFITGDITKGNLRLLNYESGYIKSQFLNDGHKDSLLLNYKINPIDKRWIDNNGKIELLIEEFDKMIIFNEFGLIENEIQKPEPNLSLLSGEVLNTKYLVFGNLKKNELYLLSSFGNQINTKPILGSSNFTIIDSYFIVYFNSQIWVYKLD